MLSKIAQQSFAQSKRASLALSVRSFSKKKLSFEKYLTSSSYAFFFWKIFDVLLICILLLKNIWRPPHMHSSFEKYLTSSSYAFCSKNPWTEIHFRLRSSHARVTPHGSNGRMQAMWVLQLQPPKAFSHHPLSQWFPTFFDAFLPPLLILELFIPPLLHNCFFHSSPITRVCKNILSTNILFLLPVLYLSWCSLVFEFVG